MAAVIYWSESQFELLWRIVVQMSWTWGAFSPKLNQATLFEELL